MPQGSVLPRQLMPSWVEWNRAGNTPESSRELRKPRSNSFAPYRRTKTELTGGQLPTAPCKKANDLADRAKSHPKVGTLDLQIEQSTLLVHYGALDKGDPLEHQK